MVDNTEGRTAASSKPSDRSDGSPDPARQDRAQQTVAQFRDMSQAERLNDKRMNPAAKQVAAMDAAINQKYGRDSPEAAKMRTAARIAVSQTLERGSPVRAPRVRDLEQQRETTRTQARDAAETNAKDLER